MASELPVEDTSPDDPDLAWDQARKLFLDLHRHETEAWGGVDEFMIARYLSGLSPADEVAVVERQMAVPGPVRECVELLKQLPPPDIRPEPVRKEPATPSTVLGWLRAQLVRPAVAWSTTGVCALALLISRIPQAQIPVVAKADLPDDSAAGAGSATFRPPVPRGGPDEPGDAPAVARQDRPRQYYGGRHSALLNGESYDYRVYNFRENAGDPTFKQHVAVLHKDGADKKTETYLYFYNPVKKRFWCRFALDGMGENRCSVLPEDRRPATLAEAVAANYPKPVPMPAIPGSSDGATMALPTEFPDEISPEQLPKGMRAARRRVGPTDLALTNLLLLRAAVARGAAESAREGMVIR